MPISTENFKPALWKDGESDVIYIPRPILSGGPQWRWSTTKRTKVPGVSGERIDWPSWDGVNINFSGLLDQENGTLVADEAEMWDYVSRLNEYMNINDDDRLELFLYYDPDTTTYVKFKNVIPQALNPEMGDQPGKLWGYSATWFAEDPVIYTTAPGE